MTTFILVELADDGTVTSTVLSDPATVNESITVPLASLFPPAPEPVAPVEPVQP